MIKAIKLLKNCLFRFNSGNFFVVQSNANIVYFRHLSQFRNFSSSQILKEGSQQNSYNLGVKSNQQNVFNIKSENKINMGFNIQQKGLKDDDINSSLVNPHPFQTNIKILKQIEKELKHCSKDRININLICELQQKILILFTGSANYSTEINDIFLKIFQNLLPLFGNVSKFAIFPLIELLSKFNYLNIPIIQDIYIQLKPDLYNLINDNISYIDSFLYGLLVTTNKMEPKNIILQKMIAIKILKYSIKSDLGKIFWAHRLWLLNKYFYEGEDHPEEIQRLVDKIINDANYLLQNDKSNLKSKLIFINYLLSLKNLKDSKKSEIQRELDKISKNYNHFVQNEIFQIFRIHRQNKVSNFDLLKKAFMQFQDNLYNFEKKVHSYRYANAMIDYISLASNEEIRSSINALALLRTIKILFSRTNFLDQSIKEGEQKDLNFLENKNLSKINVESLVNCFDKIKYLIYFQEILMQKYKDNNDTLEAMISVFQITKKNLGRSFRFLEFLHRFKISKDSIKFKCFIEKINQSLNDLSIDESCEQLDSILNLSLYTYFETSLDSILRRIIESIDKNKDPTKLLLILQAESRSQNISKGLHIISQFLNNFNYEDFSLHNICTIINNYLDFRCKFFILKRVPQLFKTFVKLESKSFMAFQDNDILFSILKKFIKLRSVFPNDQFSIISSKLHKLILNSNNPKFNLSFYDYSYTLKNSEEKEQIIKYLQKNLHQISSEDTQNKILAIILEANPTFMNDYNKQITTFLQKFDVSNILKNSSSSMNLFKVLIINNYPLIDFQNIIQLLKSSIVSNISWDIFLSFIPLINHLNNNDLLGLFFNKVSQFMNRNNNNFQIIEFITEIKKLPNPSIEIANKTDQIISESIHYFADNINSLFFLNLLIQAANFECEKSENEISKHIRLSIKQHCLKRNKCFHTLITSADSLELIKQQDKFEFLLQYICPELLNNQLQINSLLENISMATLNIDYNAKIYQALQDCCISCNMDKILLSGILEKHPIKLIGSFLVNFLNSGSIDSNQIQINKFKQLQKRTTKLAIKYSKENALLIYYLNKKHKFLIGNSQLKLLNNYSSFKHCWPQYLQIFKCLELLKVQFSQKNIKELNLTFPIFLPTIQKIVLIDEDTLNIDMLKLICKDILNLEYILIPRNWFKKPNSNLLISEELFKKGVQTEINLNTIPIKIFTENYSLNELSKFIQEKEEYINLNKSNLNKISELEEENISNNYNEIRIDDKDYDSSENEYNVNDNFSNYGIEKEKCD